MSDQMVCKHCKRHAGLTKTGETWRHKTGGQPSCGRRLTSDDVEVSNGLRPCATCKLLLSPDCFYKAARKCKGCAREYNRRYHNEVEKFTERYKRDHRIAQANYRQKYPERVRAQQAAQNVPANNSCERCGVTSPLHKHHPDYSKPKQVVTLCVPCHEKEHHAKPE